MVEIVVERSLYAVVEQHTDQTRAALDGRGHLLDDGSIAPLLTIVVKAAIPKAQIKANLPHAPECTPAPSLAPSPPKTETIL